MRGTVRETHYDDVREEYTSEQQLLDQYSEKGGSTTIAVVSLPRDTNIDVYCDEWMPALGMPKKFLKRYWEYRSGFRTNSACNDPEARAFEEAKLEMHYDAHLRNSSEAREALRSVVNRVRSGEDITFVCFEQSAHNCHRSLLVEAVEDRLRDSDESKFDFVVPA